jgi:hypothetical protein
MKHMDGGREGLRNNQLTDISYGWQVTTKLRKHKNILRWIDSEGEEGRRGQPNEPTVYRATCTTLLIIGAM